MNIIVFLSFLPSLLNATLSLPPIQKHQNYKLTLQKNNCYFRHHSFVQQKKERQLRYLIAQKSSHNQKIIKNYNNLIKTYNKLLESYLYLNPRDSNCYSLKKRKKFKKKKGKISLYRKLANLEKKEELFESLYYDLSNKYNALYIKHIYLCSEKLNQNEKKHPKVPPLNLKRIKTFNEKCLLWRKYYEESSSSERKTPCM